MFPNLKTIEKGLRDPLCTVSPLRVRNIMVWQIAPALLSAILAVGATVFRLKLWRFDLHVPIMYWGDALYETVLVKALTESWWNYHIPRLGAPFGMDAVDFPIGCTLDFAIIKVLSFLIRDACLLINIYWLLSIGLAVAFATLYLR